MKEGAPGWKVGAPFFGERWRRLGCLRKSGRPRQLCAFATVYRHSPHKDEARVGRTSLYSHLVMGQSALAETGGGGTAPMPPQDGSR
jgi:hypothetical protein